MPGEQEFVLPTETRTAERDGDVDLYVPDGEGPHPAIVFVHGGPLPAEVRPRPREWPVFRGYGSLAASRGVVGVTVDHRLYDPFAYPAAAEDVAAAVERVRKDPRVDADRIAVWFFSGGSPLLAGWLRTPPSWLKVLAATYPLLGSMAGWELDARFLPVEAVAEAGDVPIVLTRVGRERPELAVLVEAFVDAARACGARLEIVDVPNGQHAFDMLDHTEESREAVEAAFAKVLAWLS
jgi:acetyl esterase/lipase